MSYQTTKAALILGVGLAIFGCKSMATDSDNFLARAAQDGQAEVMIGQLALTRASTAEVRAFAERMVQDHGLANQEIAELAMRKSVSLPSDISTTQKSDYDNLSKLSGLEFDKEYMEHNVKDHEASIKEFESQSQQATDLDIQAFASRTLPTLQMHLDMARQLDSSLAK